MSFLKSVAKVVSAPVTVPLKATSNVIDSVAPKIGFGDAGAKVSNMFSAPYEVLQKGADFSSVLPGLQGGLSAAGTLVTDPSGASAIYSLVQPGQKDQPVQSTTNPFYYAQNEGGWNTTGYDAGIASQQRFQQILFFGALGGGALLVILMAMRRR